MSVAVADVHLYKSSQTDSDGGTISSTEITDNTDNNLFPDVGSAQTVYRKIFIKNEGSVAMNNVVVYISVALNTNQASLSLAAGTDSDTTPPTEWDTPTSYDNALALGTIAAGESKAVWLKLITIANTTASGTGGSVAVTITFSYL